MDVCTDETRWLYTCKALTKERISSIAYICNLNELIMDNYIMFENIKLVIILSRDAHLNCNWTLHRALLSCKTCAPVM